MNSTRRVEAVRINSTMVRRLLMAASATSVRIGRSMALASAIALGAFIPSTALAQRRNDEPPPRTLAELGETVTPGVDVPPALDAMAVKQATAGGLPYESRGVWGMSPHATPEQVRAALERVEFPEVAGPVEATWQSLYDHYRLPSWLEDGKFGIFIHFGLYSVPAHGSEWYDKHVYAPGPMHDWHVAKFGPLDKFGYKDFIPLFTLPKFDPAQWAEVFRASGARWVMPTAEHHDWFSLWNSQVNRFNSVAMGPKRDVVGELGDAVRAADLRFGVTNHVIEHYDFIERHRMPPDMKHDLDAPGFEDFYWSRHSDERLVEFLAQWLQKNIELVDGYRPSVLWFDNGVNHRVFDPLKLKVAAYYYNRAREWGEEVTITGKGTSFIAGDVQDFEGVGRMPREMTDFTWMVHEKMTDAWGYTEGTRTASPRSILNMLVEVVCRNGVFALNVAPKGDGSIPDEQQQVLRAIGGWLEINGEAIYGSRVWTKACEGSRDVDPGQRYTGRDIRFTAKDGNLYAIVMAWPDGGWAVIASLPAGAATGRPDAVTLLGRDGELSFTQDAAGLKVSLPGKAPGDGPYVLHISGLTL
jgi:alpha-L-fucosidase